jgi:hypothetical protein
MSYREELVGLITNGIRPADIYIYFRLERHLSRATIIELLNDTGVSIALPPSDDPISDERRRELQRLSMDI